MKKIYKLNLCFWLLLLLFSILNTSYATDIDTSTISTYSPNCILMEASTGKVLYEKDANVPVYPASTTKILTAILTLEKCQLSDIATVSHDAIFTVPVGYSHASIKEGEELTIEQLLNVLLIPSANDAANVLAEHISGSVAEFSNLMNEKAKEIGCKNTNFVNPNGVHHKDHVSTAYDLALMGQYAMKNNTFREIVKKTRYTLPTTNKYDKTNRVFNTTNDLLRENNSTSKSNYYYPDAIGIKTGYTGDAGSCIVAGAQKNGMEVIAVVLGGETTSNGLSERYLDCKTLFNYAFDNFSVQTLHESNSVLKQIDINGATKESKKLNLIVKDDITVLSGKNELPTSLEPNIVMEKNLKAPIALGQKVGTITYSVHGTTYSSDLTAGNTVYASNTLSMILHVLLAMVAILLLAMLLKPNGKKKKKKHGGKSNSKKKKGKSSGNYKYTNFHNLK